MLINTLLIIISFSLGYLLANKHHKKHKQEVYRTINTEFPNPNECQSNAYVLHINEVVNHLDKMGCGRHYVLAMKHKDICETRQSNLGIIVPSTNRPGYCKYVH